MAFTKATNTVIDSNTIVSDNMQNNVVETRHYTVASITLDKLASNAQLGNAVAAEANVVVLRSEMKANDYGTWSNLTSDYIAADTTISNQITDLQANDEVNFTANTKIFDGSVIVSQNLLVSGDTVTFEVGTHRFESNLLIGWGGDDASAINKGISILGTGSNLIANIRYVAASISNYRIGRGTLTSADDIARTQDYQSNDFVTWNGLNANIVSLSSNTVDLTGDQAMTGELTLSTSTPTSDLKAASKGYVDTQIATVSAGTNQLLPFQNSNTENNTNNTIPIAGPNVAPSAAHVMPFLDGVFQGPNEWVLSQDNVKFKIANLHSPRQVDIMLWYIP